MPKYYASDYPELNPDEIELARNGRLIDAIKEYRNRTGLGLAECKCAFDVHYVPPKAYVDPVGGGARITAEEMDELFAGKSDKECLEIALRQMLAVFDTPISRRLFRDSSLYQEAIDIARRVIPFGH